MYSILLFTTLVGLSVALSHYETDSLMREIQLIRQEQLSQIKICQHNIDYIVRENKAIRQRMVGLERENRIMLDKLSRLEKVFQENEKSSSTHSIKNATASIFDTKFKGIPLPPSERLLTHQVASSTESEAESNQEITRTGSGINTEQPMRNIDTKSDTQQPIRTIDTLTKAKSNQESARTGSGINIEQPMRNIDTKSDSQQPIRTIDTLRDIIRIIKPVDTGAETHQSMLRQSESNFLTPTRERSVTDSTAGETECANSKKLIKRVESATNAVGFYAALAPDVSLGDQQDVKFDHVYTNLGQGYEPRDGHFRAPVAGLYLLSATVLSAGTTPDDMLLELVKNGANVGQIYATKSLIEGSRVIVLSLDVGDMVWVRHMAGDPGTVANGAHYSTFSGVLISAFGSTS